MYEYVYRTDVNNRAISGTITRARTGWSCFSETPMPKFYKFLTTKEMDKLAGDKPDRDWKWW